MEELNIEELKSIEDDFAKRIDYKITKERLNLNRQVSQKMQEEVRGLIKKKVKEKKNEKVVEEFGNISNEDITTLSEFFRCDSSEVLNNLCALGVDYRYMLRWLDEHGEVVQKIADSDEYAEYRKHSDYGTYFKIIETMMRNNKVKDEIDELLG